MKYTTKQLSNMTDMEYDILINRIGEENGFEGVLEFWEDYIRDMEEYNPGRNWKPEHY